VDLLTASQILLFAILVSVMTLLIWGRWRYDLVAFSALIVALLLGVVPVDQAFSGFGHPATIIVALVLVISRGLSNSGAIELATKRIIKASRPVSLHIGIMATIAAALSTVMNNVAALALLMPVDIDTANKAKRSPALTLMPLSFATILGGMVTLIGTPPNIIVATFRGQAVGQPFTMFDFAPVGAACATAGVLFITLIGWRLIPSERRRGNAARQLFDVDDYLAELEIQDEGKAVGARIGDLEELSGTGEIQIIGLIRNEQRLPSINRDDVIQIGDVLLIQGRPEGIEKFAGKLGLEYMGTEKTPEIRSRSDLVLNEVVVPENAFIDGQTIGQLRIRSRFGVNLVGISRRGMNIRARLRQSIIHRGDILLLMGSAEALVEATRYLGCLPLAGRGLQLIRREKAGMAALIFAGAILLASAGLVQLPIVLGGVVALYAFTGIVPIRELYDQIEWPVIVLLGSLIPLGQAFDMTGGASLIAGHLVSLSHGYSHIVVLIALMVITMMLADVINNTATAVIASPVAIDIARELSLTPDPFLMGVAVASCCPLLTPIGHKNNTLILGPGGYRFTDYWRLGAPLELLVLLISIPLIQIFWPLHQMAWPE
jgi:di/tricarboxylate transporter